MFVIANVLCNIVADAGNYLKTAVGLAELALIIVVTVLEERISVNLDL